MPATTGVRQDGDPAGHGRRANPFAADEHALIITAEKVYLPSHRQVPLRSAVDSVEKLRDLIMWAWSPKRTQKMLRPKGAAPQVWILGTDACENLGLLVDPPDGFDDMPHLQRQLALATVLSKHLEAALWPFTDDEGWELRSEPGPRILLTHGKSMVDIVLEPFAWLAGGSEKGNILGDFDEPDEETEDPPDPAGIDEALSTSLPEDDEEAAQELGRRLAACVQHLGVLPSESAGRTGAAIADTIWRARVKKGQGLVIDAPGPVPDLVHGFAEDEDIEPAIEFTRDPASIGLEEQQAADGSPATLLAELDQRGSYLGSTGIEFGYGDPIQVPGDAAVAEIRKAWDAPKQKPLPFGLYYLTLPAGEEIGAPGWLPLPHPRMRPDQRVQTWVTGVSVEWLCKPVEDGGAGLAVDELEIEQAWLWPQQARALDAWTKVLRDARQHFVDTDDLAMVALVKAIYQQYIGRMKNPDMWKSKYKAHHHQPVWRAAIMAHARWRARGQAMRIHDTHGLKPLQWIVDALIYLLAPTVDGGEPPDLEDHSTRLGQLQLKRSVPMSAERYDQFVVALASATRRQEVARAIAHAFKEAV